MPILNANVNQIGQSGVNPAVIQISTNDTLVEILQPGYLNVLPEKFNVSLTQGDIALVTTKPSQNSTITNSGAFSVTFSAGNWSLNSQTAPGQVILPTIANHIAVYTNTGGTLSQDVNPAINAGSIQAGLSGTAGALISYPATPSTGFLEIQAASNSGNTGTIITNAAIGQATTLTIPDPGASTANFLLNTGTNNILTMQQFVPLTDIFISDPSNWTLTRVAAGNYSYVHTTTVDSPIIGIEITPYLRLAANKGFSLQSIDFIYLVGGGAPVISHTVALYEVSYADNTPVSITSIPLTGVLPISTPRANPYVANIAVTTPGFLITARSKYNVELSLSLSGLGDYSFYGINLNFKQTIA